MKETITPREAFKLSYRLARNIIKRDSDTSAYMAAHFAIDEALYGDEGHRYDYHPFLAVDRAVLWAIHWRFKSRRPDLPKWKSERHMGFHMDADGCEVWFENPRLP